MMTRLFVTSKNADVSKYQGIPRGNVHWLFLWSVILKW